MNEPYKKLLDEWPKGAGPKPTKQIKQASSIKSCRFGSLDTLAVAMALRPKGTTQQQIVTALGNKHRNKIMSLVRKRQVKRVKIPSEKFLIYKIELK